MTPDPFLTLAARALRLARDAGAVPYSFGWTRMQRLRRPPKAIFVTAATGPDGVSLTVQTTTRVLAHIDHDASIDVLRMRRDDQENSQ